MTQIAEHIDRTSPSDARRPVVDALAIVWSNSCTVSSGVILVRTKPLAEKPRAWSGVQIMEPNNLIWNLDRAGRQALCSGSETGSHWRAERLGSRNGFAQLFRRTSPAW